MMAYDTQNVKESNYEILSKLIYFLIILFLFQQKIFKIAKRISLIINFST